jgi:hypothetical protein
LPPDCVVEPQTDPAHVVAELDGVQIILEIRDTSTQAYTDTLIKIYDGQKQRHPDIARLEELPDLAADLGVFTVRSITYADEGAEPATALYAYCKLNYRYIYCITLRDKDEVPHEMPALFTSATVYDKPFEWIPDMMAAVSGCVILGLFFILNDVRKKHFRSRVTGVIIDAQVYVRGATVFVAYRPDGGAEITGEEKVVSLAGRSYARKKGRAVEISYSEKKPHKVHIISYKEGYVLGMYFLGMAALGVYLMLFHL